MSKVRFMISRHTNNSTNETLIKRTPEPVAVSNRRLLKTDHPFVIPSLWAVLDFQFDLGYHSLVCSLFLTSKPILSSFPPRLSSDLSSPTPSSLGREHADREAHLDRAYFESRFQLLRADFPSRKSVSSGTRASASTNISVVRSWRVLDSLQRWGKTDLWHCARMWSGLAGIWLAQTLSSEG